MFAYAPPPPDSPEVKALAAELVAAPDDAARDRLLAAASPALRDHGQLGHALNAAWQPIIYTGDYVRAGALGAYTRRLMVGRGNAVDAADAQFLLGFIDGSRGDNQTALEKFSEAQRVFENAGDMDKFARVLAGEAKVHLQLGDYQQALAESKRALEIYQAIGVKEGVINTLNTTGGIFMAQGLTERALEYRRKALLVAGDDAAWQVYLFHNIANVYARRGECAKAIDWMSESVTLATRLGDRPNMAAGLQDLGGFHLQNGQPGLAEEELRRALGIAREIGEKRRLTATLSSLGDLLRQRGDEKPLREAKGLLEQAVSLARETGEPGYIWHSNTILGQILLALRELDRARAAFEESIAAIEDTRGHLAADDAGATAFLEDKMDAYHGMVTLLVQENRPAEALAMAERAKARVLIDILGSPKLNPIQAMTAEERASARCRTEEISALNRQIAAARAAAPPVAPAMLVELERKLAAARRARDASEEDFFIAHPELRNRRPPCAGGLSSAALGGLLTDGKTALLEYVVGDKETFLFTVTKGRGAAPDAAPVVQAQRLALDRSSLSVRTEGFRAALAERSLDWEEDARALGKDLLDPVWAVCAASERLIIVADGPLWELPFQALLTNEASETSPKPFRTLWDARAVSFAPSLTFLAQSPATSLVRPARLLACGNPALAYPSGNAGGNLSPDSLLMDDETRLLPDAERQVRALARLYGEGNSKVLVGADAHEDTFKQLAGDYDVIHFATHGFLNDTAPMYSRLLMAQTNLAPDEDGLLEAWEWLPLRLHARLAVLSACETGRGRVGAGEGMIGLSWALFRAGCPAVVVSQWKVDSASSTELMIAFHTRLLAGDSPAEALRGAGMALAKDVRYRHPFYWAPFVLVGAGYPIAPSPSQRESPVRGP